MLRVLRIFDQLRGEGQALVGEVRIDGQLLVGGAIGQQRLELAGCVDQQVGRGLTLGSYRLSM
ncbi:hypothetical protein D3C84_1173820 [compost metagenome]